jgi:hypothetical protein
VVEVEVNVPNTNWHFRPLQRAIRGPFDMAKMNEPLAKIEAANWPLPIPGQRLGIDREGIGYLEEPLHAPAHAAVREKIEKRGMRFEPVLQTFPGIDVVSWHFWLMRAVECGLVTVVKGSLPTAIDATLARKDYINAPAQPTANDRLTAAIEAQTHAFRDLTAAITQLVASK